MLILMPYLVAAGIFATVLLLAWSRPAPVREDRASIEHFHARMRNQRGGHR